MVLSLRVSICEFFLTAGGETSFSGLTYDDRRMCFQFGTIDPFTLPRSVEISINPKKGSAFKLYIRFTNQAMLLSCFDEGEYCSLFSFPDIRHHFSSKCQYHGMVGESSNKYTYRGIFKT